MLTFNNMNISLDKREPGANMDFVSHAHSDHISAVRSSKLLLASDETVQLLGKTEERYIAEPDSYKGIELLEAGHMLGSRQLCINEEASGSKIIYTGDFQMERSKTSKPISLKEADTVILDSTYCEPHVKFESKAEIETAIQEWAHQMLSKGIVLFTAYAMGKAQELTAVLNEVGITPVVSKKINKINKVYTSNGIPLEYASVYDEGSDYKSIMKGGFVGITENRNLSELKASLKGVYTSEISTAVVTGFSKIFRFDVDMQFPFSDHADFLQSTEYIDATKAKSVYTYGPNSGRFAENLQKEGYNAAPFSLYSAQK